MFGPCGCRGVLSADQCACLQSEEEARTSEEGGRAHSGSKPPPLQEERHGGWERELATQRKTADVEQARAGFGVGQQEEFTRRGKADSEGQGRVHSGGKERVGEDRALRCILVPSTCSSVRCVMSASLLLVAQPLLRRCPEPRPRAQDSSATLDFGVSRAREFHVAAHTRKTQEIQLC